MSRSTAASSSTREFVGAWDLVVFLRSDPPRAPGRTRTPTGPGRGPVPHPGGPRGCGRRRGRPARPGLAGDPPHEPGAGRPPRRRGVPGRDPGLLRPGGPPPGRRGSPTTTRPTRPRWPRPASMPGRPPLTPAAAPAGPSPTCGPRSARRPGPRVRPHPGDAGPRPARPPAPVDRLAAGPLRRRSRPVPDRRRADLPDGQRAAARAKLSMPVEVKSIAGSTLGQARTSSRKRASGRSKAA